MEAEAMAADEGMFDTQAAAASQQNSWIQTLLRVAASWLGITLPAKLTENKLI
jgi:hypothetical protein